MVFWLLLGVGFFIIVLNWSEVGNFTVGFQLPVIVFSCQGRSLSSNPTWVVYLGQ